MTTSTNMAASLLIAFVLATASGTASARTVHDGLWSVVVAAEAGPCNGAYRYPVAIVNGYVRHANTGDRSFNIFGRVDRAGHVRVQVSRGDQSAYGVGRLSRLVGSGTWQSPNGCAGHWEATRRD
jgi:hypothetical protein